jgi:hypothetical protein
MSNARYIELDSSYRDRNTWPHPAEFVVEVSQTGQKNATNALDPVSNASPILIWNNSFRNDVASGTVAITSLVFGSPSDGTTFRIMAGVGQLRTEDDFYNGAVLELVNGGTTADVRIIDYDFINTIDEAQVTVSSAIPSALLAAGTTGSITIPVNNTITSLTPQLFVPTGGSTTNFYVGCLIQNMNTGEIKTITGYDSVTNMVTLASNTVTNWNVPDTNFAIRDSRVGDSGALLGVNPNGRYLQLATTASGSDGIYDGSFLRIVTPLPVPSFSTNIAPYAEERRITRYTALDGQFVAQAAGTFTLPPSSSTVDGFYVGMFITDVTGGGTAQVLTYDGATRSGTVGAGWGAPAAGNTFAIRTVCLSNGFSTLPAVGDNYEVEIFTRDNSVSFVYTGSMVSQQEMVCYEVELLNLILPNSTLSSGRGGRIAFYPYVYVELTNQSASSAGTKGVIYSNNPHAYRMLFRAAIDDTPTPLISPFIKIDGDGMVQTVKFKPNDALHFAVYLPNGELFQVEDPDYVSPTEPNPLVQISALFSIKRL